MEILSQEKSNVFQITKESILKNININKNIYYTFFDGDTLSIDINKDSIKVYYSDYQNITQGGVPLLGEQNFKLSEKDKAVDIFIRRLNSNRPDKKVKRWLFF